jgi:hypothetical protein
MQAPPMSDLMCKACLAASRAFSSDNANDVEIK